MEEPRQQGYPPQPPQPQRPPYPQQQGYPQQPPYPQGTYQQPQQPQYAYPQQQYAYPQPNAYAQPQQPQSCGVDPMRVDQYLSANRSKLPADKIAYLRERLMWMDQQKFSMLTAVELKDPTIALILSILLGELGVDRFYIGDVGLGVAKLLVITVLGSATCGVTLVGTWIWWLIDCFLIMGATRNKNYEKLVAYL